MAIHSTQGRDEKYRHENKREKAFPAAVEPFVAPAAPSSTSEGAGELYVPMPLGMRNEGVVGGDGNSSDGERGRGGREKVG